MSIARLLVSLDLDGTTRPLGVLGWQREERRAYFEYDAGFLRAPLPLSPFRLRPGPGALPAPHEPFDGLHGLFSDSLPDGWGRRLMERHLRANGTDPRLLTPLDRLAFVGGGGMGALRFRPETAPGRLDEVVDLDWLAGQVALIQGETGAGDVDRLLALQGNSAGVRPKIVCWLNPTTGAVMAETAASPPNDFEPWLLKFRASHDPRQAGEEEYAYSLMARAAGVDVPATRLLRGGKGVGYFAVRRFDRTASGAVHTHTAAGLLEADHRTPALDYATLLRLTWQLTRDASEVAQMFRRMVFNVLAQNRDDHARNHAFQMGGSGHWRATPAYDLTLSDGPGGEHALAVAGEGRQPGEAAMHAVAAGAAVPAAEAGRIIDEVRRAVADWPRHAEAAGITARRRAAIGRLLSAA